MSSLPDIYCDDELVSNKMFILIVNITRKSLAKGASTCTAQLLFLIAYCGAQWLSWQRFRLGIEGLLVQALTPASGATVYIVSSCKTLYPLLSTGLTQD